MLHAPGQLLPALACFEADIPGPLKRVLAASRLERLAVIRNCFERDLAPSGEFLRWLLENPGQLVWPRSARGQETTYGPATQESRKKLLSGDMTVQANALAELCRLGIHGSRRKWWAFEGFTSVDCLLETDALLLLIEGKRTERISSSTDWFPQRNQIIRNLECAREMADAKGKDYLVLLCAEEMIEIPDSAWCASLPHLSRQAIQELKSHYLGCVTWSDIAKRLCPALRLPDTIDEAIDYCVSLRKEGPRP